MLQMILSLILNNISSFLQESDGGQGEEGGQLRGGISVRIHRLHGQQVANVECRGSKRVQHPASGQEQIVP